MAVPERARRAVPNPGAVFPAGRDAAARSPHIAFLWEMHVLAIHTPRRAARVHNTCLLPPRVAENPTGSGALPPMHDFRWALETLRRSRKGIFFLRNREDTNETFVLGAYVSQIARIFLIRIFAKENSRRILQKSVTACNFLFFVCQC